MICPWRLGEVKVAARRISEPPVRGVEVAGEVDGWRIGL